MTTWIVIPNWEQFQHYRDRSPAWIKLYTRLHSDDAYRQLSGHQRAVLIGLWIEYASSGCQVRVNTASISRRLGLRVSSRTLDALNHAGFIQLSASRPLAPVLAQRREEKKPPTPLQGKPVENHAGGPLDKATLARFDAWVGYEGRDYVDDPPAFADEVRRRFHTTDPSLTSQLLDRAREAVHDDA